MQITLPMVTDSSPTIKQLLDALKKKLDPKTQGALDAAKLKRRKPSCKMAALATSKGQKGRRRLAPSEVDRAADLWSMLPTSIAADSAVKSIATWLGKNIGGTEYLGNLPCRRRQPYRPSLAISRQDKHTRSQSHETIC